MAVVVLQIGDRQHRIACKDGTEERLRHIATKLDSRWEAAQRASGGHSAERSMLFVALMLADALDEAERPAPVPHSESPDLIHIAERLEAIATALEKTDQSA